MKRQPRQKYDPLVDEVELVEANPQYAHVRLPDGRETTVSVRHLAPRGTVAPDDADAGIGVASDERDTVDRAGDDGTLPDSDSAKDGDRLGNGLTESSPSKPEHSPQPKQSHLTVRRSSRTRSMPKHLERDYVL